MKKLVSSLLFGMLYGGYAYAGIISVPAFSADSGVPHLETFRTVVSNAINGQIQGSGTTGSSTNILADSLGQLDMADEINPRVRAAEILGIGVDTTSSSKAFLYTGLQPATSATLTSNISTGTAYINGYRVNKSATSETYTASKDTYVDLSQTGAFTLSAVANGAAAPAVAANSIRLAKVITNGTAITTVTSLANTSVPGLAVAKHYRAGLIVSKDSATQVSVYPGTAEINGTMLTTAANTPLLLSTSGNWAEGSVQTAADTFFFVGEDANGNIKLTKQTPTNSDYALTSTVGKYRYATVSSTTYRIIGWFYVDGASSVEIASNIKEGDTGNAIVSNDTSSFTTSASSAFQNVQKLRFYSSGGNTMIYNVISCDPAGSTTGMSIKNLMDGVEISNAGKGFFPTAGPGSEFLINNTALQTSVPQGGHTYTSQIFTKTGQSAITTLNRTYITVEE